MSLETWVVPNVTPGITLAFPVLSFTAFCSDLYYFLYLLRVLFNLLSLFEVAAWI